MKSNNNYFIMVTIDWHRVAYIHTLSHLTTYFWTETVISEWLKTVDAA